ncbi:hypothetical protein TorRG33x02_258820 [Trema orientale]|uniref:Uncharacterized protein n=1 Tax=Trema orientale TaxID=63057 RepID=A0A2P5D8Q7_TREOI|nr:hypothetical protein TorRG33x02_258820 [Trema orientale]
MKPSPSTSIYMFIFSRSSLSDACPRLPKMAPISDDEILLLTSKNIRNLLELNDLSTVIHHGDRDLSLIESTVARVKFPFPYPIEDELGSFSFRIGI